MSECEKIYKALWKYFDINSYDYQLENSFVFRWESDFFCISKSGYIYELEVKTSRSDFNADFRKRNKHEILSSTGNYLVKKGHEQYNGYWFENGIKRYFVFAENKDKKCGEKTPVRTDIKIINPNKSRPHKFVYVTPKGLISADEVPEYAGLMQLNDRGKLEYIKQPPFLHKDEIQWLDKKLLQKFYWAYIRIKQKQRG